MADLLQIIDLAESDQVQLSYTSDSGQTETAPPVEFSLPLTESESAEIRWYINDYPENTFGESSERARRVETGLKDIGILLFRVVFGSNDEARALAEKAFGTEPPLLAIVSTRPEFLGLPWELLNNGGDTYLASQLDGISRRVSSDLLESFSGKLPTDCLLYTSPSPRDRG